MKKTIGIEISPNVIAHVSEDAKPETIEALKQLALLVGDMSDYDLKEVEIYAHYLHSKRFPKPKIGRPRKAKK